MASTYAPVVRRAVPGDAPAITALVEALADYEKLLRPDAAAKERLIADLFATKPRIECWLAFMDAYPVGYAITFEAYSSFLALPTLYLEDLFVLPEYRSRKAGLALFREVVSEAKRRDCGSLAWTVLDWNALAIQFYERLGGRRKSEWLLYRLGREDFDGVLAMNPPG